MNTIPVTITDIPRHIAREREAAPNLTDRELLERATAEVLGDFNDPALVRKALAIDEAELIILGIFEGAGYGIPAHELPSRLAEASTDFVPVADLMARFIIVMDSYADLVDGVYYPTLDASDFI